MLIISGVLYLLFKNVFRDSRRTDGMKLIRLFWNKPKE
jgi:hypothetical protein